MANSRGKKQEDLAAEVEALRTRLKDADSGYYEQMVNDLPQIIFEMNPDGRYTFANDLALKTFGYTREDLRQGLYLEDIIHPDSLARVKANISKVFQGRSPDGGEYLGQRKDGSTFPLKVYSQGIFKDGVPISVRGVMVDISDIKKAEEALLASENHYRTLFESTGTAMVIFGEDTIIQKSNKGFSLLSEYPSSEIEGKMSWTDIVVPKDLGPLLDKHQKRLTDNPTGSAECEFSLITRTHRIKRVHSISNIIPGTTERICSVMDITRRVQTEEALRKSEERYELVVRGAHDGIWDWDLARDTVYYSPRYKEILGYTDEDFPNVADSWRNAIHPDDLAHAIAANAECIEGKVDHFQVEFRMRHKNGTYRWILGRGASARDENGTVYRLAGTHTDISERKKAETSFREIFENASDGIYQCTTDGRMLTANTAMARCFGYDSPEELIESITDIRNQLWINPEHRDIFLKELEASGSLQNYEENLYRKDGSRIWVSESVRMVYDSDGSTAYYEGFLQDITPRKLHENTTHALYAISKAISTAHDLKELYETIHVILGKGIDATNFYIGMLDEEEDRIIFTYFADEIDDYYDIRNVSDPETKGLTAHVLRTGKPLFLSRANDKNHQIQKDIGVVGTLPAVWLGVPLLVQGKAIGVMAVQHYSNPLHYSDTDVAFMEAVSEQVALAIERKTNEESLTRLNEELESMVDRRTSELSDKAAELETANERLRELDKIKSSLVSSISHELRTPLTSIRGFAKLTGRDFTKYFDPLASNSAQQKKGERIRQNLRIIETEGERLTRLINDFLDINRIESGKASWHDSFINPCDVIRQAVNAVAGGFASRADLELIVDLPSSISLIHADPDKIQQVLINLLNNACKFTKKGSVTVASSFSQSILTVSVRDTGSGIAEHELGHVFEKFHKTSGDTITIENKGTGLGLAICKEIVEHYGGTIWVESTLGTGSTFSFTLPCVEGAETSCI